MRLDERDRRLLALWAADCAAHVLAHFEERRPRDERPRRAVEAVRAWARGEMAVGDVRAAAFAAHAAARAAPDEAARAAARAAGQAAGTAHVAGHAVHAARYAAKCVAADAARVATAKERDWQRRRIPKHLRRLVHGGSR